MNASTGSAYDQVGGFDVVLALCRRWHALCLQDPVAAPAEFVTCTGAGLERLPLSYSGSLREAWRELHAAVTAGGQPSYGLRELASDLALVPSPR